jgi:hypothetical protein
MLNPRYFQQIAVAADKLGFESLWMPEHLVFPQQMAGSPFAGQGGDTAHPPVPPETPLFDVFAYLSFLAGQTSQIRLGTNVYLMGLRHPFIAARAIPGNWKSSPPLTCRRGMICSAGKTLVLRAWWSAPDIVAARQLKACSALPKM